MQESNQSYESCIAISQLKFYCQVMGLFSDYTDFFTDLMKSKLSCKNLSMQKSDEIIIKSFVDSKNKELTENFRVLQKEVIEKVKELENFNKSISLDLSEISESPQTPKVNSKKLFDFGTPQERIFRTEIGTKSERSLVERKSRIKSLGRKDENIKKCLFKTHNVG